jgi:hypothetical protein
LIRRQDAAGKEQSGQRNRDVDQVPILVHDMPRSRLPMIIWFLSPSFALFRGEIDPSKERKPPANCWVRQYPS